MCVRFCISTGVLSVVQLIASMYRSVHQCLSTLLHSETVYKMQAIISPRSCQKTISILCTFFIFGNCMHACIRSNWPISQKESFNFANCCNSNEHKQMNYVVTDFRFPQSSQICNYVPPDIRIQISLPREAYTEYSSGMTETRAWQTSTFFIYFSSLCFSTVCTCTRTCLAQSKI